MLAYILGITKLGIKRIRKSRQILGSTNRGKRVTNIGSLRDFILGQKKNTNRGRYFKLGQRDFKSGQRLQIRAIEITNRDRDLKLVLGLQIGAEQPSR